VALVTTHINTSGAEVKEKV